jgi:hypothetical protein
MNKTLLVLLDFTRFEQIVLSGERASSWTALKLNSHFSRGQTKQTGFDGRLVFFEELTYDLRIRGSPSSSELSILFI